MKYADLDQVHGWVCSFVIFSDISFYETLGFTLALVSVHTNDKVLHTSFISSVQVHEEFLHVLMFIHST